MSGTTRVDSEIVEYVNGRWFDGSGFVDGARLVSAGHFTESTGRVANSRTVDLNRSYIVPPLADAHSHHPDIHFSADNHRFLEAGVMYVLNANNLFTYGRICQSSCGRSETIDGLFAHAGFTCKDGHPAEIYDRLAISVYSRLAEQLEGLAYNSTNSIGELECLWPAFLATQPDIVKLYLLDCTGGKRLERRGLALDVFYRAVELAHSAGLRAAAHVETAADFHHSVAAGVDFVMHVPGYRQIPGSSSQEYLINTDDLISASMRRTIVVTTAALLNQSKYPELFPIQRTNFHNLRCAKVRLAIGSDRQPGRGLREEIRYLETLDVFSRCELIRLAVSDTATALFPHRAIGILSPPFEASFIATDSNPLVGTEALTIPHLLVKRGVDLGCCARTRL